MEWTEVIGVISNVGFPIVCVIYLGVTFNKSLQALTDAVSGMRTSVENNTDAVKELKDELQK